MALPLSNLIPGTSLAGGGGLISRDLAAIGILPPQWGIFDSNGNSVVNFDTVLQFEYKNETTVADYPLERGAFESYDKVASPYSARFVFASGGSLPNRTALLRSLDTIAGDLKLYDVITPEFTYLSANIIHIDYNRQAATVGLLKVAVWLAEIRVTTDASLSATAAPSGADSSNGGQVQAEPVAPQTAAQIKAKVDATAPPAAVIGGGPS